MGIKNGTTDWKQIKKLINQHKENNLEIGQEYMDEDGTIYQVANIDTERHEVIFSRKCLLPETNQMNFAHTNLWGYKDCRIRKYLNKEAINQLSSELRAVITPREFKVSEGFMCSELDTLTDLLFLPREGDVFAEQEQSFAAKSEYEEGGTRQWDLFKKTKERIKTLGDEYGAVSNWWLASPSIGNSSCFCFVTKNGVASNNLANCFYGIAPCFMIAAEKL